MHRLDARYKLLFTLAFVIAVVATPIGQWRRLGSLGLLLALLVGISGAPVRSLVFRWAGFALVVGFLAVMVAPGLPARASHGLVTVILSIVVKNSLAFLMMLVLATVTSWLDLLQPCAGWEFPECWWPRFSSWNATSTFWVKSSLACPRLAAPVRFKGEASVLEAAHGHARHAPLAVLRAGRESPLRHARPGMGWNHPNPGLTQMA